MITSLANVVMIWQKNKTKTNIVHCEDYQLPFFLIVSLVLFYMHISIYVSLENLFKITQACGEPYSLYGAIYVQLYFIPKERRVLKEAKE